MATNEENARNLITHAPVGIFYTDGHGDWSYVNKSWSTLTGLSPIEANNKAWRNALHPEDRARCQEEWEISLKEISDYFSEHRYVHKDGHIIWVKAQAYPQVDANGNFLGFIGTLFDITEEKQKENILQRTKASLESRITQSAEQLSRMNRALKAEVEKQKKLAQALSESKAKWQSLVENAPDSIITIDQDEKILFINHLAAGFSMEKVIGTSIYKYLLPESHEIVRKSLHQVLKTGQSSHYQAKGLGANNSIRYYSSRVGPIRYRHEIVGATIIATDITEFVRLEEQFVQNQREVAYLSKLNSLVELTTALAHEINQPLAAISNYAKGCIRRLENNSIDKQQITGINHHIVAQAERAGDILIRMRSLVKKAEINKAPININETLKESLTYIDPESMPEKFDIEFLLNESLPQISADKVQIQQVIINIVQNALEATITNESSPPRLHIETTALNSDYVSIKISDNGGGISEQDRAKIFTPLYSTKPKGMGMGLSICWSIIEAHRGQLQVTNNSSEGATFQIILPIK